LTFLCGKKPQPSVASTGLGARVWHKPGPHLQLSFDHRPVTLSLLARSPQQAAPQHPRRVCMHCAGKPQLLQRLEAQAATLASTAPTDSQPFLVWWPRFKQQAAKCGALNKEAWALRSQQGNAAAALLLELYQPEESCRHSDRDSSSSSSGSSSSGGSPGSCRSSSSSNSRARGQGSQGHGGAQAAFP